MHGSSSVSCEVCGETMTTSIGATLSEWVAKREDPDRTLRCSSCRAEVSDPSDRDLGIDIECTKEGLEITINFINNTEQGVTFGMNYGPEEETQWSHEDAWKETYDKSRGVVGLLYVVNEDGGVVFEHLVRRWFSTRDPPVPESQMTANNGFPRGLGAVWSYPDSRDEKYMEFDPYIAEPKTSPFDYEELTVCFELYANPREAEWPVRYVEKEINVRERLGEIVAEEV